jgi:hypothetical protein
MYTLYTDKTEDFKCNIGVEGATINNTKARLVLESKDMNLLFEGSIDSSGNCIIPIKKLKHILPEGIEGMMKLEVIADDTYFSPWEDSFQVKVNKKVTVEVANDSRKQNIKENKINIQVTGVQKENKQIARVSKVTPIRKRSHSDIVSEILNSKGINLKNFDKHINKVVPLVEAYVKKYNVKESTDDFLNEVIINLK